MLHQSEEHARSVERSEEEETEVASLGQEFGALEESAHLGTDGVDSSNNFLFLSFSILNGPLAYHVAFKSLLASQVFLLLTHLLVKLLLLDASLELVLVFEGLSLHLLLSRNRVFVCLSSRLLHRFFLLQLLAITLQFELHLVFGLTLGHFRLKLSGLSLFFLGNLRSLDGQLLSAFFSLLLLRFFRLQRQFERLLSV